MSIIETRKIWFSISGLLAGLSILAFLVWGLNLGIDFTGGSLLEIEYPENRPPVTEVRERLSAFDLGNIDIQATGESEYLIRFKEITEDEHQQIFAALGEGVDPVEGQDAVIKPDSAALDAATLGLTAVDSDGNPVEDGVTITPVTDDDSITEEEETALKTGLIEKRFDSIGPVIGEELKRSSIYAIITVLLAIVLYIAYAFRKVSYPVQSWKYGLTAIITLFHDISIVIGIFVLLGRFAGVEVNMPFVAALLTILGYSVNDTIVVFDRIRENVPRLKGTFAEIIDQSVKETYIRSVNTSVTTLVVLIAIYLFGGVSIQFFVLALILGVIFGTYSSIFLASPLLYEWQQLGKK